MTPTSEIALEMGCVWMTTLMAQTTATIAKAKKRMTSISRHQCHQQTGHQKVDHGHREEELPGETHELVIAKAGQRAANPDESEEDGAGFGAKPEQRQQPGLHRGQQEQRRDYQEDDAE